MTFTEARKILELHNKWRRDNNIPNQYEMVNPTELGNAIDTAIDALNACITVGCEYSSNIINDYSNMEQELNQYR